MNNFYVLTFHPVATAYSNYADAGFKSKKTLIKKEYLSICDDIFEFFINNYYKNTPKGEEIQDIYKMILKGQYDTDGICVLSLKPLFADSTSMIMLLDLNKISNRSIEYYNKEGYPMVSILRDIKIDEVNN